MACDNEGEKLFFIQEGGEWKACEEVYVRENGEWKAVCNVYSFDNDWNLVFPMALQAENDFQFHDEWFTTCGVKTTRGQARYRSFNINAVQTPEEFPAPLLGLGGSVHHFQAYGRNSNTFNPYGTFKWLAIPTSSVGATIFDGRDWGYFGSIVRRFPKVTSTSVIPAEFETLLWVRPSLVEHLGRWTPSNNLIFKWDNFEVTNVVGTQITKALNVPYLPNDVDYYEYRSQNNKGSKASNSIRFRPPDCCWRCTEDGYDFASYSADQSPQYTSDFAAFAEETQPLSNGSYLSETAPVTFAKVELAPSSNNTGHWVIFETHAVAEGGDTVYCGENGGHPCHKGKDTDSDKWVVEKEYVVALVAHKDGGTGAAFSLQTHYNNAIAAAGGASAFYADTGAWNTYDGGDNVFIWFRYRTDCFSAYHETPQYSPKDAVVKEFWIAPQAWSKVNGGTAWPSNGDFIGMVMDVIPSGYSDVCQPSFPDHMATNLPKYYFWNIPLNTCPNETNSNSIVPYEWLTNNTGSAEGEGWAWGTPVGFESWTSSTGRQDLLGAGVGTGGAIEKWGGFDPAPTAPRWEPGPHPAYSFDLYEFNRYYGSLQSFPYGVGHAYGLDQLAPAPWCPCTVYQQSVTPDAQGIPVPPRPPEGVGVGCPCGSGADGSGEWGSSLIVATNTYQCCTAYAQQTQVYMISKAAIQSMPTVAGSGDFGYWDTSEFTGPSGVPSTITWRQTCAQDPDSGCTSCGGSTCQPCDQESSSPFCANCCVCTLVGDVDDACVELEWDEYCVEYNTSFIYCCNKYAQGVFDDPFCTDCTEGNQWLNTCVCS